MSVDFSKAQIAIVGPKGVGKTQFLTSVLSDNLDSPLGSLVDESLRGLVIKRVDETRRDGTAASNILAGLSRRTFQDVRFQASQKGTEACNILRVSRVGEDHKVDDSGAFDVVDFAGGWAYEQSARGTSDAIDTQLLEALKTNIHTVVLLVPYWSVLRVTMTPGAFSPLSATFESELKAWLEICKRPNIRRVYVLLNQFSLDFEADATGIAEEDMQSALNRVNALCALLAGLRVMGSAAEAPDLAGVAADYVTFLHEMDLACRALFVPGRFTHAGDALTKSLLGPTGSKVVRVAVQNTLLPNRFTLTGEELYVRYGAESAGELDRWRDAMGSVVKLTDADFRASLFFPVEERLTWLPFFLADLAQEDARGRW